MDTLHHAVEFFASEIALVVGHVSSILAPC
jgi:hypothetical protein